MGDPMVFFSRLSGDPLGFGGYSRVDQDGASFCIEPDIPDLSQEPDFPGCLPLPAGIEKELARMCGNHPDHHQAIMPLPVNKIVPPINTAISENSETSVLPLPCEQDACVAWDYGGRISVLDISEAFLCAEPVARKTKARIPWMAVQSVDQNGNIIDQWYDEDEHPHIISEWEYKRRLSMYFQSWLEFLYPEFFGPSLLAGGGWHQWQYWKVRRTADRPENTGQQRWPARQTRHPPNGKTVRPVATVQPVQQARFTKYQPRYQRPQPSPSGKVIRRAVENDIDTLLMEFESGQMQNSAARHNKNYDGRKHGWYCSKIKNATKVRRKPLTDDEKLRFVPFMRHLSQVVYSFNGISLSTCVHSLVASQLIYHPRPPQGQRAALDDHAKSAVKKAQHALIKQFITVVKSLAKRPKEDQYSFDGQAISNLLWALAKLVEREVLTPEQASEAVTALLLQVQNHQAEFKPQEIVNLLWALAKLVERKVLTPEQASEAVTALLPQVQNHWGEFTPQGIANLLWALAKLVERKVLTPEQASEAVTALLPQVQNHQAEFRPQEIANLLWALVKLVEREVLTPEQASEAVTALLPQVQNHQAEFRPQEIANLLWALAKLVELEVLTPEQASEAVTALLPQVQNHQAEFKPQEIANLLWALAKLVEREVLTPEQASEAVTALLLQVQNHQAEFIPQHVANLLWALAKLVEREVLTPEQASEAVTALLPQVQNHWGEFTPQGIANLLWALAKLVEREVLTPEQASEAVTALLPQVQNHWGEFTPQGIANLLWALAKLVENGRFQLDQGGLVSQAVTALLPQVQNHQAEFIPQHVANLLWALAALGDGVSLDEILNILKTMEINTIVSWRDQEMTLWALTVFLARGGETGLLLSPMKILYDALIAEEENNSDIRATIMRLSGTWLEKNVSDLTVPNYKITVSHLHRKLHATLSERFPDHALEMECSINGLPPVDLLFPDKKVVVEVQGAHHYVDKGKKIRNGSTILKTSTYKKLGYIVFEIPASDVTNKDKLEQLIRELNGYFLNGGELSGQLY